MHRNLDALNFMFDMSPTAAKQHLLQESYENENLILLLLLLKTFYDKIAKE